MVVLVVGGSGWLGGGGGGGKYTITMLFSISVCGRKDREMYEKCRTVIGQKGAFCCQNTLMKAYKYINIAKKRRKDDYKIIPHGS